MYYCKIQRHLLIEEERGGRRDKREERDGRRKKRRGKEECGEERRERKTKRTQMKIRITMKIIRRTSKRRR